MSPRPRPSRRGPEEDRLLVSSLLLVALVLGLACGATTESPEPSGERRGAPSAPATTEDEEKGRPISGEVVVTGTLTGEGVECPALRGDSGELYTLTGAALDGIETGDRLRVRGSVAKLSYCMQGRTIDVEEVERLDSDP